MSSVELNGGWIIIWDLLLKEGLGLMVTGVIGDAVGLFTGDTMGLFAGDRVGDILGTSAFLDVLIME